MTKVLELDLAAGERRELAPADLNIDPTGDLLYWIHLGSGDAAMLEEVAPKVGLPAALAAEWVSGDAFPGLSDDANSIALAIEYWDPSTGRGTHTERFYIFLTERACLTYSPTDVPCIEHVMETYERNLRFAQSIGFVLFLVLDRMIGDYVRMLQPLEALSEQIDGRIYEAHDTDVGAEILALKRKTLFFKRVTNTTLHTLMQISGRKMTVITDAGRDSLTQVYGHAQMLVNALDSLRDMVSSSQDALMTLNSEKLNETMKVLTLFASILLPMTVIAGIYGMNFQNMPELLWEHGYFIALGSMGATALILLTIFKLKHWF